MDIIIIAIAGILLGGVVNALVDGIMVDRPPGVALNWRHPLTGFMLAALMVLIYVRRHEELAAAPGQMLIWALQLAASVLIVLVDLAQKRILIIPLGAVSSLALFDAAIFPQPAPALPSAIAGGLVGFGGFLFVYFGGRLFQRIARHIIETAPEVTVFGLGDVYLMAASGLILGFPNLLVSMLLTIFLGGSGAVLYLIAVWLSTGRYFPFSILPYSPFILTATYLVLAFQREISVLLFS